LKADSPLGDDGQVRELPTGTVTFLFTDIEGSTRLIAELGEDGYAEALVEHRRVVREAFLRGGGVEVDTQGDAFFVAFPTAPGALEAAREAQGALSIPVRMGVHTGTPVLTNEGYVGTDVHKAARIAAAAHGGQVLLSQVTRDLCSEIAVRDLGEHRLKDLSEPQRLYQLVGDGLESEFSPPNTLENQPTNLPTQPTPLLGRDREIDQVVQLLDSAQVRLVTLTGPGGTGKTRLALQAAAEAIEGYPAGVFFVNLAALTDPELVVPTIAQTLGVKEQAGEPLAQTLARDLAEKELLLVLDNFEQVVDAAPAVAELLRQAPGLSVLVTSRSSLHLQAEHEYAVPPLEGEEAVALFAERAQAVKASFTLNGNRPLVAEICRRLDQLPLAIELAAARMKLLPEQALLARLDDKLKLLTGGARDLDPRQRTLRATIDWSYEMLSEQEQALLRRLAVFGGGRALEAIEAICAPEAELDVLEGLDSLLDKSLLRQEETEAGEPRFVMLETIHEYAREKLEHSVEAAELRNRHADFFLELAESRGDAPAEWEAWFDRIEVEHDNLRTAIAWAQESGAGRLELRLAAALGDFWHARSYLAEGLTHISEALAHDPDAPTSLQNQALRFGHLLAFKQRNLAQAREWAERLAALAEESGDEQTLAYALNSLGITLTGERRFSEARVATGQSLAIWERLGNAERTGACLHNLGLISMGEGAYEDAVERITASAELFEAMGDEHGVSNGWADRSFALIGLGRWRDARVDAYQSLLVASRLGWRENVAYCLVALAAVAVAMKEPEQASRFLGQADRIAAEVQLGFEPYAEQTRIDTHEEVRSRLPRGRLDSLLAEGRAWSIDDAVRAAQDGGAGLAAGI
jgi:predicted ATPase/class 3 adenylate cyclase